LFLLDPLSYHHFMEHWGRFIVVIFGCIEYNDYRMVRGFFYLSNERLSETRIEVVSVHELSLWCVRD
jgi:hypothetical protein